MAQELDPKPPLAANEAATAATESAAEADSELAKARAEAAEWKDAFLRAKAETENVRKVAQADIAKAYKYAVESFAEDLLPVKDALEKAIATESQSLEAIRMGVELTLKALESAFARAQIGEVAPAAGDKFDPNRHEAMQLVPSTQPANTIVDTYQKGYFVNDRILRPALVTVSSGEDAKGG